MKYLYFQKGADYTRTETYDSGLFKAENGGLHPNRILPYFVLLLGVSGKFDICEDDVEYALLPNTYLILLPEIHHYGPRLSAPNLAEYFLNFTIENGYSIIDEQEAEKCALRISASDSSDEFVMPIYDELSNSDRIQLVMKNLIESSYVGGPYKKKICEHDLNIILTLISQNYINSVVERQYNSDSYKKVHSIMKWIKTNYKNNISVAEIARHFNYNPIYLTSLFKSVIGMPIIKYINDVKIKESCMLLLNSDMTVKEIAYECGFHDSKYFSKVFKEHQNIEPSKYRSLCYDLYIRDLK